METENKLIEFDLSIKEYNMGRCIWCGKKVPRYYSLRKYCSRRCIIEDNVKWESKNKIIKFDLSLNTLFGFEIYYSNYVKNFKYYIGITIMIFNFRINFGREKKDKE